MNNNTTAVRLVWDLNQPAITYIQMPWICSCGTGHKVHEIKCVKCNRPRQIWVDEKEISND